MSVQIGAKFKSIEEYKKIHELYLDKIETYTCLPFSALRDDYLISQDIINTNTAVIIDINELTDKNYEILQYLSVKILIFTAENNEFLNWTGKILKYLNADDTLKIFYLCNQSDQFIKLHQICDFNPRLSAAIFAPNHDLDVWKTLPVQAVFLTKEHFRNKSINPEFIPFITYMNKRGIPTIIDTDISNFTFCFFNVGNILQESLNKQDKPSSTTNILTHDSKYELIENAFKKAIETKGSDCVVTIVNSNRGKLLEIGLKHGAKKINIIEKDHDLILYLKLLIKKENLQNITLFEGEIQKFNPETKSDIILMDNLGGFDSNYITNGLKHITHDKTVIIPQKVNNYLIPVSSHCLYAEAVNTSTDRIIMSYPETYIVAGEQKLVDREINEIEFLINKNCTIHGFIGCFECTLYGNNVVSNFPGNDFPPVFFPLRYPVNVKSNEKISIIFSICHNEGRVWYEWSMQTPHLMPIQKSS